MQLAKQVFVEALQQELDPMATIKVQASQSCFNPLLKAFT